jgi:hypothetical protein
VRRQARTGVSRSRKGGTAPRDRARSTETRSGVDDRARIAEYVAILQRWASAEESSDVADQENDDPARKDR